MVAISKNVSLRLHPKMKNNIYLLITILFCTLAGCRYSYKDELVTMPGKFSMSLPNYLSKADNLKPGADLQYSNRFRNTYVVVFSDKKDKPFEQYYNEQIEVIKKSLEKPMVNDSLPVAIAGATGTHTEIAGTMQGEMIYYSIQTLETKDKFYQECIWTRGEERKLKYGKDLERMLTSFKLAGQ